MASKQISNHADVAKRIRSEMKRRNIDGRVRSSSYAGGCSVDVDVEDLSPTRYAELSTFAHQFQRGNFNGMTDSYEYTNSRDDIPQVSYVFVNNRASRAMQEAARDWCAGYWAGWDALSVYEQERRAHAAFARGDQGFWETLAA